jgi:hypothetical protein
MKNMKTTKQFLAIAAIFAITLALLACDDDNNETKPTEVRKDFTDPVTITGLFDNQASAKVEGRNLTDKEWAGVAETIKAGLNANFNTFPGWKQTFINVFNYGSGVTIIVEKNPTNPKFDRYSTTRGKIEIIRVNFDILSDVDDLGMALQHAMVVMDGVPNLPETV